MARPKKTPRKQRNRFTPEAKAAAVARFKGGVPAKQVAEELHTTQATLYNWVHTVNKHRAAPNNAAFDRFEIAMRCIQELNQAPSNDDRLTIIKALERCYTRDA